MVKRICEQCGKSFEVYLSRIKKGGALYCSNQCRYSVVRRYRSKGVRCFYCGNEFYRAFSQIYKKTFCGKDCERKYRISKKVYIECKICNKKFYIKAIRLRIKYKAQYCSRKCYGTAKRLKSHISNGYVRMYSPYHPFTDCDGNVYEHRLVMEKFLSRFLKPKEEIHHLNEIKSDNRLENLRLFSSRSEHLKFHKNAKKG
jgi:hypothetical protein